MQPPSQTRDLENRLARGTDCEKRDLYFEIGCLEFWTVGATGKVRFFDPESGEVEASPLCPAFPSQIDV